MSTLEVISLIVMIISILISLICLKYTFQTKKRYEKVAMKLGNGTDISEILKDYIKKVNQLDVKDDQIIEYCNKLNNDSGYTFLLYILAVQVLLMVLKNNY